MLSIGFSLGRRELNNKEKVQVVISKYENARLREGKNRVLSCSPYLYNFKNIPVSLKSTF